MRKTELRALTGIRFYAALCVFLSHVSVIPGLEELSNDALPFNLGVVGVSFFFVLSGFILTYNYAETFRETVTGESYARFVWDRATKIFPLQWATLAVMIPVQVFSPNLPLDWRAVPFHFSLLQCFWPFPTPRFGSYLNVPSWSISCEWFFYLIAPLCMFCIFNRRLWWLPLTLALIYLGLLDISLLHESAQTRFYYIYNFAPSRALEFIVGILLAKAYLDQRIASSRGYSLFSQAAGLGLIAIGAIYRRYAPWPFHGGLLYVPGSLLLISGLASGQGWFASHLSTPALRRLGMASFSFYLIHVPMLRITKGFCLRMGWEVRSWTGFVFVALAMYAIIQSAALLIFQRFELPVQRWLRQTVFRRVSVVPNCSLP